jgi:hypothetical protein
MWVLILATALIGFLNEDPLILIASGKLFAIGAVVQLFLLLVEYVLKRAKA